MKLQIRHARVQYGADIIIDDINFEIHDREKIAVVGRNGCGKTTLLKLISGELEISNPDSDESCAFNIAGGVTIGTLKQINFEDKEITAEEEIRKVFRPIIDCKARMEEIESMLGGEQSHNTSQEAAESFPRANESWLEDKNTSKNTSLEVEYLTKTIKSGFEKNNTSKEVENTANSTNHPANAAQANASLAASGSEIISDAASSEAAHNLYAAGKDSSPGELISQNIERLLKEYDSLQKRFDAMDGYSYEREMKVMFQSFGFSLEDLKKPMGTFSGGQQTKIAFMKLLLSKPDVLLLDEPTNHLDLPTIMWLENYLKNYKSAVVIVSHDRAFLDGIVSVAYEIEYHRITRYSGNYTAFVRQKEEALAKQEKDYEAQQKEIKRLTEWIEKWKNTPTKVATAHSKEKAIEHMVKIEKPRRFDRRTFHAHFSPRIESWNDVLNVKALDIGYTSVLSTVNFKLTKGQRIAIIGENGRGKSTLLKTIVGLIPSLGGTFNIGNNVEWGYFDQQLALNSEYIPTQTVLDNFWDAYPKLNREEARSALGAFVFSGEEVEKQMGQLSGGERVRLALCKMFYSRPNLLILDEPTNHMDMLGKESLEEMLLSYQGTVLVVSHDRYFIDRVATGILDFEGGSTRFYPVPYKEYIEIRKKEAEGPAASQPMQKKASSKPGNASQTPSGSVKNPGNGMTGPAANASASDALNIGNNSAGSDANASAPKKLSNNPGKERARLERKIAKLEKDIAESESKAADIKNQMEDPEVASSYSRLMELQAELETEESLQENLLNELMECEEELELYLQ